MEGGTTGRTLCPEVMEEHVAGICWEFSSTLSTVAVSSEIPEIPIQERSPAEREEVVY